MAQMADADRLLGLPIFQVHGRLDWMFPVEVARQAREALAAKLRELGVDPATVLKPAG
jgi:phospholipase/carboxylesterase